MGIPKREPPSDADYHPAEGKGGYRIGVGDFLTGLSSVSRSDRGRP